MASINKVILVANLGRDPETRYTPSGDAICNLTVATTDTWKDKTTGERRESTEWHRVVFFGKLAEIAGQYLRKGSQVYVEGALRTRKWTDQNGQDRYTTEIRADTMQMLGRRPTDDSAYPTDGQHHAPSNPPSESSTRNAGGAPRAPLEIPDDDIPFAPPARGIALHCM